MSEEDILKYFELEYSGKADEVILVYKYRAVRSGARIVVAQVEGAIVKGFFCLATEAHDDDGLPAALENLIFMGSKDYPYKGVLDFFARRRFGFDVDGDVYTDHTLYSITTNGSESFLNLMPIHLDHIFFPTLKESAYLTEIHHITGEGEDGGKMYTEVEENEDVVSKLKIEMLRDMYPGHCGYKSVTDGLTKNLRESTSLLKVKSFHKEFYRPENLCIIVCGMVEPLEVLKTFLKFEEKIVSKPVDRPVYVRPWQSEVPPLSDSVERTVKYESEAEERGMVTVAWRGPPAKDQVEMTGLRILFDYLSNSHFDNVSYALMDRFFIDIDDPFCKKISYFIKEYSVSCVYLHFDRVPHEKLEDISSRILGLFLALSGDDSLIHMDRIQAVIRYHLLHALKLLEYIPHDYISSCLVKDFLYGKSKQDTDQKLNTVPILRDLRRQPVFHWIALIKKYFVDKHYVAIVGEPSVELMSQIKENETKRVTEQKERLKDELIERQKLLELAIKENEIQPPEELLLNVPVPNMSSVQFIPIKSSCNYADDPSMQHSEKFPLDDIPISFQLADIKSKFVTLTAVLDSSGISEELRHYLPLYTSVLLDSPVLRKEKLMSYKDVMKELDAETVSYDVRIGVDKLAADTGRQCGIFSMCVFLTLKVELEKYMKGVEWLHALLYDVQFDVDQLMIAISRNTRDVETLNSCSYTLAEILMGQLMHAKGSNEYVISLLRQNKFLEKILDKLDAEDSSNMVLEKLKELKVELTDPARLKVHMSADVDRLVTQTGIRDAVSVWSNVFLPSAQEKYRVKSLPKRDYELLKPYTTVSGDSAPDNLIDSSLSLIIGSEEVVSSSLHMITPSLTEFRHADVPAIMLYMQYLTGQEDGLLYKQIRSDYGALCKLSQKLDYGYLEFIVEDFFHVVETYRVAKKIIEDHSGEGAEFNPALIEVSRSGLLSAIVSIGYETVDLVSIQSLLSFLRGQPHDYVRWLMNRIPEVSADDMRRVSKLYFTSLFNPTQSKLAISCPSANIDEICQIFKTEFHRELTVVKSLDEPCLVNM